MEIFSKKTLLNAINGGNVVLGGAPSGNTSVKFQIATGDNAIARAAASKTAGALTFASDSNGNAAIFATNGTGEGTLVSSKILNITSAAKTGAKHGGKTVTITYVDTTQTSGTNTATFDVIDEAGLEAYFAGSKTIALTGTDTSIFEVKTKVNGGIKVDEDGAGLYVDVRDLFGVDGKTIDFDVQNKLKTIVKLAYNATGIGGKPAIQLQTSDSSALSEVTVEQLIGSGIVESTSYNPDTNILTINWVGGAKTTINLSTIIDISDYVNLDPDYLTITADTSVLKFGVTDKTKNAVTLAETALQSVNKTKTAKTYVDLTVGTKTSDTSTQSLEIVETGLIQKFTEVDGSIGDISTRFDSYKTATDLSIGRLDTSVNDIEDAIKAMDADVSTAVDLDAQNGIYVRGTLTEKDGVVTGITAQTLIANTSITRYNKDGDVNPAWELNSDGLLNGDAATKLKTYVDDVAAQIKDEAGAVDSSMSSADSANFISIHEEQEDGAITVFTVNSSYGAYNYTAATHTFGTATDGIGKVADTQTFVQNVIESLDLNNDVADASAHDSKNYIKSVISETNGIVKNESLTTTYGEYKNGETAMTNGVATVEDTSAFVDRELASALSWIVI